MDISEHVSAPTLVTPKQAPRRLARQLRTQLQATLAAQPRLRLLRDDELTALWATAGLPDALAIAAECAFRALGLRANSTQLLAALALAHGALVELATGEGKTLALALGAACCARGGDRVHVATANDYLARRDSEQMQAVYARLGLATAVSAPEMTPEQRREAYGAAVLYSTAQQLGFDFLSDQITNIPDARIQGPPGAAIHQVLLLDEADALMLDEARTPLVIGGPDPTPFPDLGVFASAVATLPPTAYALDIAQRSVSLTEEGAAAVSAHLQHPNLYADQALVHRTHAALRAQTLYLKGRDYVVVGDPQEVLLVDEHTGRIQDNRRFQHALHEALEAKEGLAPNRPTRTLYQTTLPAYFTRYGQIGGMTGTIGNDADELWRTYATPVVRLHPHRPNIRVDHPDRLFATSTTKMTALVGEITRRHATGQPILVGTPDVVSSETLSAALTAAGITHNLLNATHHGQEAVVVAQAGRLGAVTVTTAMAGRGVDIRLGGHPESLHSIEPSTDLKEWVTRCAHERAEVIASGGLCVLSTARHTARRTDDQMSGRAARQGEPGESMRYLACDDELLSAFGGDKFSALMQQDDGNPFQHSWITKIIDRTQRVVESIHAAQRQQVWDYDQVVSSQRDAWATLREGIFAQDFDTLATTWFEAAYWFALTSSSPHEALERIDPDHVKTLCATSLEGLSPTIPTLLGELSERLADTATKELALRFTQATREMWDTSLQVAVLQFVDDTWATHLRELDRLQEGVALRSASQLDPRLGFALAAQELFIELLATLRTRVSWMLWHLSARDNEVVPEPPAVSESVPLPESPTAPDLQAESELEVPQPAAGAYSRT